MTIIHILREMADESPLFRIVVALIYLGIIFNIRMVIRNATMPEPIRVDHHSIVFNATFK